MWKAVRDAVIKYGLLCAHDWQWLRAVVDEHVRSGYKHPTSVHICVKCGKLKTLEHK